MTDTNSKYDSARDGTEQDRAMAQTLAHYGSAPERFWRGTQNHDVRQNIDALLDAIEGLPPFTILDFGCGPGRDLKSFRELGHVPIGLEGVDKFANMAREYAGCEVWQQNFVALELPPGHFDGVFANASLFHVPSTILPRVLQEIHATLNPGGVLFSSNPRGQNEEGMSHGRYGCYHDLQSWRAFVTRAGFVEVDHYYRPVGLPREQQPWLASVWRKVTERSPR